MENARVNKEQLHNFWSKITLSRTGCWEWTACIFKNGYGKFNLNSRTSYAHRIAFNLVKGDIPTGKEVCHTCDYRLCCNPWHMFAGTRSDNMKDAVQKKRLFQQNKTCCPKGHMYTENNTLINVKGARECKMCIKNRKNSPDYKLYMKNYRNKQKELLK